MLRFRQHTDQKVKTAITHTGTTCTFYRKEVHSQCVSERNSSKCNNTFQNYRDLHKEVRRQFINVTSGIRFFHWYHQNCFWRGYSFGGKMMCQFKFYIQVAVLLYPTCLTILLIILFFFYHRSLSTLESKEQCLRKQ